MSFRLKNFSDYIFKQPSSFEDQKRDEIWGMTFIVVSYSLLFFYMSFLIYQKWHLKVIKHAPGLFIITIGLALAFLLASLIIHIQLRKIKKANTFEVIKECKLKLYLTMAFFGIPYHAMAFWLLFNEQMWAALMLFLVYAGGALVCYYKDWKPFLRLLERTH